MCASGTFRDQAFDQRDYWKLIYNPEHHRFTRDFAVLFDASIDGVCGIEVAHLEPFEDNLVCPTWHSPSTASSSASRRSA